MSECQRLRAVSATYSQGTKSSLGGKPVGQHRQGKFFKRASSHSWQGEGGRSYPAAARYVSPVSKPHADLQMISPAREQQICFILLLPFRACCQPTQTPGPRVPQAGCCSAPQLGNKICSTKLRAASPAEQQGTAVADGWQRNKRKVLLFVRTTQGRNLTRAGGIPPRRTPDTKGTRCPYLWSGCGS